MFQFNMSRKAVWCFTVAASEALTPTSPEGIGFDFQGHPYRIWLGPPEDPDDVNFVHCHGGISAPPGTVMTRSRAREILRLYGIPIRDDDYLSELSTSKAQYIRYCYKSLETFTSKPDIAIKRGVDAIRASGETITGKRLKTWLSHTYGPSFTSRNSSTINAYLNEPTLVAAELVVDEEVVPEENAREFVKSVNCFKEVLRQSLEFGVKSDHKDFANLDPEDYVCVITMLILLPIISLRKRLLDNLPGLFFYGIAGSGKSYLFNQLPCYKKVPKDSAGVSRYRLDGEQSAYLFDDVENDWLRRPDNQGLIKEGLLGGTITVKTMGDTQTNQAFFVFTSNEIPCFLTPPEGYYGLDSVNEINHLQAWRRRVISVHFAKVSDFPPVKVDFAHGSVRKIAREMFCREFGKLRSEAVSDLFQPYYDNVCMHVDNLFCRAVLEDDDSVPQELNEVGP